MCQIVFFLNIYYSQLFFVCVVILLSVAGIITVKLLDDGV